MLECRERVIDARQHFFFSENFDQVIQTRSPVAAGKGRPSGMPDRATFKPELFRRGFQSRLDPGSIELLKRAKGMANLPERWFVLRRKLFRDGFGIVIQIVGKIESAVGR